MCNGRQVVEGIRGYHNGDSETVLRVVLFHFSFFLPVDFIASFRLSVYEFDKHEMMKSTYG